MTRSKLNIDYNRSAQYRYLDNERRARRGTVPDVGPNFATRPWRRPDNEEVAVNDVTTAEWKGFVQRCGDTVASVRAHDEHHHLTGELDPRQLGVHMTLHSQVALSAGAAAFLAWENPPGRWMSEPSRAFRRLMRAQPQHAATVFARDNSPGSMGLSKIVGTRDVARKLMKGWAHDFAGPNVDGVEREALLHAGVQVFTAYLGACSA
jgi:hypothetical protein